MQTQGRRHAAHPTGRGVITTEVPASHVPGREAEGRAAVASEGTRRHHPRWVLAEASILLGLAVAVFHATWAHPAERLVGSPGDSSQFAWFLEWTPHALSRAQNPFLTSHIDAPATVNLLWNTSMPLAGLLLSPVTALFGPVVAYNVLVTVALVLSAMAASLALRRLGCSRLAGFAGGVLYGFSPYALGHAEGHADLVLAMAPPATLLLLHELLVRRGWSPRRCGVALGLVGAGELLLSEELLLTTVLLAGAGVLVLAGLCRDRLTGERVRALGRTLAWAVATALPLAAVPLLIQFLGPGRVHGSVQTPGVFVTDLLNLVLPVHDVQQVVPPGVAGVTAGFTGNAAEESGYLGVPLLILLAVTAVARWNRLLVRWAVVMGVVAVVLSMGPRLHVAGHNLPVARLPWDLLGRLPLLNQVLPGRFMVFADLAAAVLLAVFVDLARGWAGRRRLGAGALLALAAVSLLPSFQFGSSSASVPAFFTDGALQQRVPRDAVVLVVPVADAGEDDQAMLWQAAARMWFRMPEGYFIGPDQVRGITGATPTDLTYTLRVFWATGPVPVDAARLASMRHDLAAAHVRAVVLGPSPHRDQLRALVDRVVGRPGADVDGVTYWDAG